MELSVLNVIIVMLVCAMTAFMSHMYYMDWCMRQSHLHWKPE